MVGSFFFYESLDRRGYDRELAGWCHGFCLFRGVVTFEGYAVGVTWGLVVSRWARSGWAGLDPLIINFLFSFF